MLRRQINRILEMLAYNAYMKIYGIHDEPFKKIEIYLSEKDNDWNSIALLAKSLSDNISEFAIRDFESPNLSNENNSWNKLAIELRGSNKEISPNIEGLTRPCTRRANHARLMV